jgi:hypothetical protein
LNFSFKEKKLIEFISCLEKHISTILQNNLLKKSDEVNGSVVTHPPIYVLSCIKDPSLSNIRKQFQPDYCVQCHSGTIRNFVECKIMFLFLRRGEDYLIFVSLAHLLPFLNQCWIGQNGNIIDQEEQQNEELLAGVTSYFK